MGALIDFTNVSLDGYIEDARGAFDWAPPEDDVFSAATALLRSAGTFLYGRRLYETMAVRELKAKSTRNLTIGGANLAAQAFAAGLVDKCQPFVWPMILGGGKPGLTAGVHADLEFLDERRFGNGVVLLRYRVRT